MIIDHHYDSIDRSADGNMDISLQHIDAYWPIDGDRTMKLVGYLRESGDIGFRNYVAVLPASVCASTVASKIAHSVKGAVALPHQHGCCQVGADHALTERTLTGLGKNPNVFSVLVVALGCETLSSQRLEEAIAQRCKTVDTVVIQESSGTSSAISKGVRKAREMTSMASKEKRRSVGLEDLILAIECGGSDSTSGLASNPAAGFCADRLIDQGGTVIISETTELIGAEKIIADRAVSEEAKEELLRVVKRTEDRAEKMGVDLRGGQPTPGNMEGGLTTIEEKSLGCIYKGGTSPLQGVLDYAQRPGGRGLYFMDTPGQDIESITGMVAAGAQIVIFTTGRGTPTGSPAAPVIKVTGNPVTYERMGENIDLSVGDILSGKTVEDAGQTLFEHMIKVANGDRTKSEILGHHELGIHKISSTF